MRLNERIKELREFMFEQEQLLGPLMVRIDQIYSGIWLAEEGEVEYLKQERRLLRVRLTGLKDCLGQLKGGAGPAVRAGLNNTPRRIMKFLRPVKPGKGMDPRLRALKGFAVGNRVKIVNPTGLQSRIGNVGKIGWRYITVVDRNGKMVVRAPKNLVLAHE